MNPNITVINENMSSMDFNYIHLGWVKDNTLIQPKLDECFCFTTDGKIVINTGHDYHEDVIKSLKVVMTLKNKLLATKVGFHQYLRISIPQADKLNEKTFQQFLTQQPLDDLEKYFNSACEVERSRRIMKMKYQTQAIKNKRKR